ncbi:MAG: hypothetical protein ACOYMA_03715 [Bacteroidia bacterium]
MKTIKTNEFIILRLPPIDENIMFITQTFGITQYIFYDDRFKTKQIIEQFPEKFNKEYYNQFREKCLEVENKEVSFTINEYFFLAKIIDFVSKCYIGEPNLKLKAVITEDFQDYEGFDYNTIRELYLDTSTKFFNGFKETCSNNDLLAKFDKELSWDIDI